MRQDTAFRIMERVSRMTTLTGSFDFFCDRRKKYPFIKIKEDFGLLHLLKEIMEEDDFGLTSSIIFSKPGKIYISITFPKTQIQMPKVSMLLLKIAIKSCASKFKMFG